MCEKWTPGYWKDFIGNVQTAAGESLKLVIASVGSDSGAENTGGYFCLGAYNNDGGFLLKPSLVGETINDGKDCNYAASSFAKAARVKIQHDNFEHVSSWQSRNPKKKQWGGAIFVRYDDSDLLFSFSGLSEHCDEAISLLVAMKVGCLTTDEAIAIANISQNTVFLRCLTQMEEPTEVGNQVIDNEPFSGR